MCLRSLGYSVILYGSVVWSYLPSLGCISGNVAGRRYGSQLKIVVSGNGMIKGCGVEIATRFSMEELYVRLHVVPRHEDECARREVELVLLWRDLVQEEQRRGRHLHDEEFGRLQRRSQTVDAGRFDN